VVQLEARAVLLGVEIRVLAVSSIWTMTALALSRDWNKRERSNAHMSSWRLLRWIRGGRCLGMPFL
jgi:hypothetical protein